ncbi:MAG: hypothetical protein HY696_10955 [Deltaproteobacteria bacterium]|nr:hypothetical protein [Deltaproteobacteria bacterium]
METNTAPRGPLALLLSTPAVRRHLVTAGRELLCALNTGVATLEQQSVESGLTYQYPYLHTALQHVRKAITRALGGTAPGPSARRKSTSTKKTPKRRRAAGRSQHHVSRRTTSPQGE